MVRINTLAIYGKSGHGKVIYDIALLCGYEEVLYIDDDVTKEDVISYETFKEAYSNVEVIIAIGNNAVRKKIFAMLEHDGITHATLIHPSAVISPSAHIGRGTVVMANVVLNAEAKISDGVILNTSCVIEHENIIESFVHISPGVHLAGMVWVQELAHIGIGSSVIQGLKIGCESTVGAGSVVIRDVADATTVVGNPCKTIIT